MKLHLEIEIDSQRLQEAIDSDQILQLVATVAPCQREAPATERNGKSRFPICEIKSCRNRAKSDEGLCQKHLDGANASDKAKWLAQKWLDHPATVANDGRGLQWQKLFDDLNRLDGLSWDEICTISDYALKKWVPQGYMLTPMKLRNRSKTYPDLKTYQIILQQSRNGSIQRRNLKDQRWSEAFKKINFT